LGAAIVMERDGGGISHILGQGLRRGRACRHLGLEHRTLGQIDAIGVDEIQYSKGRKYLTLVYQIDLGVTRLLWVGKERTIESLRGFFITIGEEITSRIVLASEGRTPLLKKSRWFLLKREENLKEEQRFRLRDLLRYNLKTVRAYLLKEAFQQLWEYNSPAWAGRFLDEWCRQTMRSRIEPMKKIARSLRQHRELIPNYFRAQKLISSGA
jgi:transposase